MQSSSWVAHARAADLAEGVAAPQVVLAAVVLGNAQVASALVEVKGRLDEVAIPLKGQLRGAGGDGHCEGVDDEALALPQVDLHIRACSLSACRC